MDVKLRDVTSNEDGTVNAVIELDGVAVQAQGLSWIEEDMDEDWLACTFDEWMEFAEAGYEGYTVL